jgi:UDP-N-acetyl-D-glucosamine dehydrogenase
MAQKLVIMGQGYVGLPLAMQAVDAGYHVVALEVDVGRVSRLIAGESYVEGLSSDRVLASLNSGRYRPTTDIEDCAGFEFAVITVPTPLRDGVPDLSCIEQAAKMLAPLVTPGACVVLESTTYPGTTEEVLVPILENGSHLMAGQDFFVGYSPERVDPGNPRWELANTPKVISGIDPASLAVVEALYESLVAHTVRVDSTGQAELVKLIENTFRHVNIALVNELAMFAGDLGLDIWAALDAAETKPFGFMRFNPGPGVGGHCLPVDPSYLAWQVKRRVGATFRFVELANDVNDHMPAYVVRRLGRALQHRGQAVPGGRILLLGLAYKPNTGDARESPALAVAQHLSALDAEVRAVDPHVEQDQAHGSIIRTELTVEELQAADAVLMLVNHDAFDLGLVARHARYVLDTRHCLAGPNVEFL